MSRSLPARSIAWVLGLMAATGIAAVTTLVIGIRFLRSEAHAISQLESFRQQPSVPRFPNFQAMSAGSMKIGSTPASEAWNRVFAQLSSPYCSSQIANLETTPSDDPKDVEWSMQNRVGRIQRYPQAWEIEPELLAVFIARQEDLLKEIHRLCDSDTSMASAKSVGRGMMDVSKLVYLECMQAIRERQPESFQRALRTLEILGNSSDSNASGLPWDGARNWWCSAIHCGLDAEMIDREQRTALIEKLRVQPDWIARAHEWELVTTWKTIEQEVWDRQGNLSLSGTYMPNRPNRPYSQLWNSWSQMIQSNEDHLKMNTRGMLYTAEDFQQSALIRLAILEYIELHQRVPEDLSALTEIGIQPNDWNMRSYPPETNRYVVYRPRLRAFHYSADKPDCKHAFLDPHRSNLAPQGLMYLPQRVQFQVPNPTQDARPSDKPGTETPIGE